MLLPKKSKTIRKTPKFITLSKDVFVQISSFLNVKEKAACRGISNLVSCWAEHSLQLTRVERWPNYQHSRDPLRTRAWWSSSSKWVGGQWQYISPLIAWKCTRLQIVDLTVGCDVGAIARIIHYCKDLEEVTIPSPPKEGIIFVNERELWSCLVALTKLRVLKCMPRIGENMKYENGWEGTTDVRENPNYHPDYNTHFYSESDFHFRELATKCHNLEEFVYYAKNSLVSLKLLSCRELFETTKLRSVLSTNTILIFGIGGSSLISMELLKKRHVLVAFDCCPNSVTFVGLIVFGAWKSYKLRKERQYIEAAAEMGYEPAPQSLGIGHTIDTTSVQLESS